MREISYNDAINEALSEEMSRDDAVFLMGEGVHSPAALVDRFGTERVRTTPISENGFGGTAVGAAIVGLRPVVEFRNAAFLLSGFDQIVSNAAKLRYMSGGQLTIPVVFMLSFSSGLRRGAQHSFNPLSWFANCPGLKIVVPSTAYDAKGLLKTAIRDNNPVIYMRQGMVATTRGEVPRKDYTIPFGSAEIRREGVDVTILATLNSVSMSLAVAEKLAKQGISAEVVDPRSLVPLDKKKILSSVEKTGRLVVVDESYETAGLASALAAIVAEEGFQYLKCPIKRVSTLDVPFPYSPPLEDYMLPTPEKITKAVRETFNTKSR